MKINPEQFLKDISTLPQERQEAIFRRLTVSNLRAYALIATGDTKKIIDNLLSELDAKYKELDKRFNV